jgi:type IX secretion system PorP/SprF family membrane protein
MLRYILGFCFVLMSSWYVQAQQAATFAQYMFNGLAINPAYAGSHDALSVTLLSRFQNVGLPGSPNTQTLSAHSPLLNRRVSVGLLVVRDKLGIIDQTGVHGFYSYKLPLSDKANLSFGLQAGYSRYQAEYSNLDIYQFPDLAFSQDIRESRPNFGAGVYYRNERSYLGVAMPHLLNNVFDRGVGFETVKQNVPVILSGGHVFTINRMVDFKPNFMFRMLDDRPVELDINANFLFDEVLWLGMSYKSSKQVALLTELKLTDQIWFGYSYTVSAGPIRVVELGSHELLLNYRFMYHKRGVVTPRYF